MHRIDIEPEADAGVREVPGAAEQVAEDAGGLREAAARRGGGQGAGVGGTDRVLREQTGGKDNLVRTGEVYTCCLLLLLSFNYVMYSEIDVLCS